MRKVKQRVLAVLLAVSMVAVSVPAMPVPVVAEAATQDVVTLNTTSLTNWTVGKSGSFYAYVNGRRVSNATLNWSSSNPSVATCVNGVLTAVGAGTAVITCTKENAVAATCTVTVKGNDVVTLNATSLTNWTVGKSGSFYAYVNGKRVANNTMTWSSDNTAVATCENGVLTAKGPGTAVISCTRPNATVAKCTVTVKGNDIVTLNVSELTNWTVGKSGSFYAYVNGKRVSNASMTWSSSNTEVATCENGVLTAVGPGTAIISCTKPNATTATCKVTVKGNDIVTLNASSLTNWSVGKTGSFYAYVNGKRVANNTMTWSSSNTAVATCVNGVLTAKGPGTAIISCTKPNATTATCTVTVKGNEVVTLNVSELKDWTVGKTGSFYAYVNGKRVANNTMTWSSSDNSVATCVNGVLTAKGPGTAIISCTKAGATTATCKVTVKGNDIVTLNVSELKDWPVGKTGTFYAYVNGKRVSNSTMTWSSSNPSVAICENGVLTTKGPGTAIISCTKAGATVASCTVTVKEDQAVTDASKLLYVTTGNGTISITGVKDKTITKINIPNVIDGKKVTDIATGAFQGCSALQKVVIPENVEAIGMFAFSNCGSLSELQIGENVKDIGMQAFASNGSLTEIYLPDSVRAVRSGAFMYCQNVAKIRIPNNATVFESDAFLECSNRLVFEVDAGNNYFVLSDGVLFNKDMTRLIQMPEGAAKANYTVPEGVVEIGASAFAGCGLQKVVLPDSLRSIGVNAFAYTSLTDVLIPAGVVSVEGGAFKGGTITEIRIDSDNANYTVEGGVLFSKDRKELVQMPGGLTGEYTIPVGVTTIGTSAFTNSRLSRVKIPNTVVRIGNSAFAGCMISEIGLPESLVTIEPWAFSSCGSLTDVVIPDGVTSIGMFAFSSCLGLRTVTIPESVTEIGISAFDTYGIGGVTIITVKGSYADTYAQNNGLTVQYLPETDVNVFTYETKADGTILIKGLTDRTLTELIIPEEIDGKSVTEIGANAFSGCTALEKVVIPGSVEIIGMFAFSGCRAITELEIGEGVKQIAMQAFTGNIGLTEVILPDSMEFVGIGAFMNCSNVTKVRMPNNATTIESEAFAGCSDRMVFEVDAQNAYFTLVDGVLFNKNKTKLILMPAGALNANYTVPTGVEEIGASAFAGCTIQSVVLPDSLRTIGMNAFANTKLAEVSIPSGVTFIGGGAFKGGTISEIKVDSDNANYKAVDGVLFSKDMKELVQMPGGISGEYTIPDGVSLIEGMAFANSRIEHVVIPEGVTIIGGSAFAGSAIREINLPGTTKTIMSWAFSGCGNLTDVVIPDGVTTIEMFAFNSCSNLRTVTVPESVTLIGMSAFLQYNGSVTIITTRGSYADSYAQSNGLTVQYLPETDVSVFNYTTVADGTIQIMGLTDRTLTALIIPEEIDGKKVTQIGSNAFSGCTALEKLVIPGSVRTIGMFAFANCSALAELEIGEGVEEIGMQAFTFNSSLTEIILPDTVEFVRSEAFSNCMNVTKVRIPNNATVIESMAFCECGDQMVFEVDADNEYFVLEDGILFSKDKTKLIQMPKGASTAVYTIPDGVEEIGAAAFTGCTIQSVVLPDSLRTIGMNAFAHTKLTEISIPSGVTRIDGGAFNGGTITEIKVDSDNANYKTVGGVLFNKDMTELVQIPGGLSGEYTIPDTVTTIGPLSVANSRITGIVIPDGVTTIGSNAFVRCLMSEIDLPESLERIEGWAFSGCMNLTDVVIPDGVTYIGMFAFNSCANLKTVTIPASVTQIEMNAFATYGQPMTIITSRGSYAETYAQNNGYTVQYLPETDVSVFTYEQTGNGTIRITGLTDKTLTSLIIPKEIDGKAVTEIGVNAFNGCTALEKAVIPGSVEKIGMFALSNCGALKELYIHEGVKDIGMWAFAYNPSLTEITLPDTVEIVRTGAFTYCQNVTKIRIPNNDTTIDTDAFTGCSAQMVFEVDTSNAYFVLEDGVLFNKNKTKLIQMPKGALQKNYTVPESVTEIGCSAFAGCDIETVALPNGLTGIGAKAFAQTKLSEILIPAGVTAIGAGAFVGTAMSEIEVDSENTAYKTVDGVLFDSNMTELIQMPGAREGEYTIPDGVTTIGAQAFYYSAIEGVIIPEGVEVIGNNAFSSCKIQELELPDSIVTIGIEAFNGCTQLTSVVIPDGVNTIGQFAFFGCYNMESITIPASVAEVGVSAIDSSVRIITTRGSAADYYGLANGNMIEYLE